MLWWYPTFATCLIGCCHDTHGSKGVLLGYLSGVLHILTTPLGCCWTTPQGCCTYSLHPWGAFGLPLRACSLAAPLGCCWTTSQGCCTCQLSTPMGCCWATPACSLARLLGAVGLSLRGCCTCSLATPLGCCWITSEGCCTCSLHLGVLLGYFNCVPYTPTCVLITHAHIIIRQWQLLCEVRNFWRLKPTASIRTALKVLLWLR